MTDQHQLLTVSAAADLAAEHGDPLSRESIQRAARLGQIPNAQKFSSGYLFTDHDFLYWLRNRPKPGPKPQGDKMNLKELIANGMEYSNTWAIYAESFDAEAPARFGQTQFDNGGVLDGYVFVGTNMEVTDALIDYMDSDEWDASDVEMFLDEWLPEVAAAS